VSFFDQELARVPLSEPEPEPIEARPPWDGPPHGVLPGLVPARVILARDDRMLVMVHDLRACPTGLLLTLALWHRQRRDRDLQRDVLEDFVFAEHPRLGGRRRRGALRFGLEFADGRRWSSVTHSPRDTRPDPEGPVLWTQGGGGDDRAYEMRFWLWPLPPPGDLTFHLEWSDLGIGPRSAAVNGQAILAAAARAEAIWPESVG